MVIKRTYRAEQPDRRPDRRSLGKVQVTIDDLRVLMDLLQEISNAEMDSILREGRHPESLVRLLQSTVASNTGTPSVGVEFDVGEFSEPGDMRELSDVELKYLRVTANKTTVHLSATRAESIGPPEVNDLVYNVWARPRQTRKRPEGVGPRVGQAVVLFVVFLCCLGATVWAPSWEMAVVISVVALIVSVAGSLVQVLRGGASLGVRSGWAIILPLTIDELRKQERGKSKWPIISATIAALALIASLTFNVINLMNK